MVIKIKITKKYLFFCMVVLHLDVTFFFKFNTFIDATVAFFYKIGGSLYSSGT